MTDELSGDEALMRSVFVFDDGRDWTAWHVWRMGERKRISQRVFAHPPTPIVVTKPKYKPKRRPKRKTSKTRVLEPCDQ